MRIAIYSRKSKFTGKGESIENQIETCKTYANTYFSDIKEIFVYEDEGFSGGNINRPQFQEMLKEAENKKFNILICYRLNRVSRNIADFSNLIQLLQDNNIEFVSVREQFDTSTAMGRAMMNISAVFAQLERETIAEQVKDNMLHLATTGRWLGGVPSLGFENKKVAYIDKDFKERSLVILKPIKKEMKLTEFFYDKYLELGSIHKVRKYLIQNNYKTRKNKYYSSRALSDILRNTAYVMANNKVIDYLENKGIEVAGKERINNKKAILIYNKKNGKGRKNEYEDWVAAVAKHEGTIKPEKWLKVQHQLDRNSMDIPRVGTSKVALLGGILRCTKCGSSMGVTYGERRKDGTAPHYYACNLKIISGKDKCDNPNANGSDIDYTVIQKILNLSKSKEKLLERLKEFRESTTSVSSVEIMGELNSKKEDLLKEINALVDKLSKDPAPTINKYILAQIEEKDKLLKDIEKEILKFNKANTKAKRENDNLNFVIDNISNFSKMVDTLDNEQKKYFIQTIVDKVYWDGEKKELAIKLFLNQGMKPSQFHTASSSGRDKTGMVLYETINTKYKYKNYPEETLGERIRKQRFLKGLTAAELAELCNCCKNTIYAYESNIAIPHYNIMKKMVELFEIDTSYFKDPYYDFVLSSNYSKHLKKWRKNKKMKMVDIKQVLGVSHTSYLSWERGTIMSRGCFNKIRNKIGV